jgi:hypothetical protein
MTLHNVFCIIKENVHLAGGPKVVEEVDQWLISYGCTNFYGNIKG